MLHKWEALLGLPEDSLVYEKEVREENAYYFCSKERKVEDKEERNEHNN